jgi:serralysin
MTCTAGPILVAIDAYAMNIGNWMSAGSTARIYLSTDSTITTSDTVLATLTSPGLAASGQPGWYDHQTITVPLPANLAPGTYYIGGIADYNDQVTESSYTDNNYNVVQISVATPPPPNLSEYVTLASSTAPPGGRLTIDATAMNIGSGASPASSARIYLSTDNTIDTSDTLLATLNSPGLAALGQSAWYDHQTISVTLPTNLTPGTYYIGGIADYNNQVAGDVGTNKTYDVQQITVRPPPAPNLSEYVTLASSTAAPGGRLTINATAMNIGNAASSASTAGIYLSTDNTITTSDTLLATLNSPGLATLGQPGWYDQQTISVMLPANLTPGTYYIGGIADYNNQVAADSGTNKTYDVQQITVSGPPAPNLSEYLTLASSTAAPGGQLTIDAYAMNIGNAASSASTAGIYLSSDNTITTSDTLLATLNSPTLATVGQPGWYDHQTISVTLPANLTPGTYYIGGIADYNNQVPNDSGTDKTYNVATLTVAPSGHMAISHSDSYGPNLAVLGNYIANFGPSGSSYANSSQMTPSSQITPAAELPSEHLQLATPRYA